MKKLSIFILFSSLLFTSCMALWNGESGANITFTYDTTASAHTPSVIDSTNNQNFITVSIINAKTNDTISQISKEFNTNTGLVSIEFISLPIVGKTIYATLELTQDGSTIRGKSKSIIMKEGDNYLLIETNDDDNSVITFSITLNYKYDSKIDTYTYTEDDLPITLTSPTRDGYSFEGWYEQDDFSGSKISEIPLGNTTSRILYADWDELLPDESSITIDAPNITISQSASKAREGDSVTVRFTANNGYRLTSNPITIEDEDGNSISAAGSNGDYTFTMPARNVDISLHAEAIDYTITYNLNNGSSVSNPASYTIETDTITLNNPSRDGYKFAGWHDGSSIITQINKGSFGNITLTAQWNTIPYNITYNFDGGSSVNNPSSYTIETDTITFNNPSRDGYEFAGWHNGSSIITKINKGSYGNISLTAQWNPTIYYITYNLNSGTQNASNPETYTVESNTITLYDPTRSGFTFDGWYENADFSGTKITEIASGSMVHKSLYAKWIQDPPPGVEAILTYELDSLGDLKVTGMSNAGSATTVTIPSTFNYNGSNKAVTSIDDRAFYNTEITSVVIPDSVTEIGASAFYSCDKLVTLQLGNGVALIGANAFQACTSLKVVEIQTLPINWTTAIANYAFEGCTSLERADFGEKLSSIGAFAFKNCTSLTDVGNTPKTLTSIGQEAFMNAMNSSSSVFYIPKSVTSVAIDAFDGSEAIIRIETGTDESGWNADWDRYYNGTVYRNQTLNY